MTIIKTSFNFHRDEEPELKQNPNQTRTQHFGFFPISGNKSSSSSVGYHSDSASFRLAETVSSTRANTSLQLMHNYTTYRYVHRVTSVTVVQQQTISSRVKTTRVYVQYTFIKELRPTTSFFTGGPVPPPSFFFSLPSLLLNPSPFPL